MNQRYGRWHRLSPATFALLTTSSALLGNLATDTIEVSWRWWPLTVWVAVLVLLAITVGIETRRHAQEHRSPPATSVTSGSLGNDDATLGGSQVTADGDHTESDGIPLVVSKELLNVDYVRDVADPSSRYIPASGHTLRIFIETFSRDRIVLRSIRPEVFDREPFRGQIFPHAGIIETRAFRLDLSESRPELRAMDRRQDFPMWVTKGHPEVVDIRVINNCGVVGWRLLLEWSVDGRAGNVPIDAGGKPFLTSQRP